MRSFLISIITKMRSSVFFLMLVVLVGCDTKTSLDIEVDPLETCLKVKRFDRELLDADIYSLKALNSKWTKEYAMLYESFLAQMINAGSAHDPMIDFRLEKFLTDSIIQSINLRIKDVFSDFGPYQKELESAFAFYSHYFPETSVPVVVPFYSSFNAKTFPYGDTLGIGLDMFLGRNEEVVSLLPPEYFPMYLKQDMDPENLSLEAIKTWVYVHHSNPGEYENSNVYGVREDFLSSLVYHGKMMWAVQAMFPHKKEAELFSYTEEEWQWCDKNEGFLFQNLIEFKLLYSKNLQEIKSYINPGSFTPGLPQESPGEIGKWIGFRMVKKYVEENKISLHDLLKDQNDARKVLSYYRP